VLDARRFLQSMPLFSTRVRILADAAGRRQPAAALPRARTLSAWHRQSAKALSVPPCRAWRSPHPASGLPELQEGVGAPLGEQLPSELGEDQVPARHGEQSSTASTMRPTPSVCERKWAKPKLSFIPSEINFLAVRI
jgi:hypothetical protein